MPLDMSSRDKQIDNPLKRKGTRKPFYPLPLSSCVGSLWASPLW